jgi:Lon protease-like protein
VQSKPHNQPLKRNETMLNSQHEQVIVEKLRALPPERIAEVEDFVDFLQTRTEAQHLTRAAAKLAESAFGRVWDNESDADYDRL